MIWRLLTNNTLQGQRKSRRCICKAPNGGLWSRLRIPATCWSTCSGTAQAFCAPRHRRHSSQNDSLETRRGSQLLQSFPGGVGLGRGSCCCRFFHVEPYGFADMSLPRKYVIQITHNREAQRGLNFSGRQGIILTSNIFGFMTARWSSNLHNATSYETVCKQPYSHNGAYSSRLAYLVMLVNPKIQVSLSFSLNTRSCPICPVGGIPVAMM